MEIQPIAHIKCFFTEKFGIPRQPGLTQAVGRLVFTKSSETTARLRGLEGFSHIWIIFGFHTASEVKNRVFSPRAGGRFSTGVWSTRSPHRPNHLGLSLSKILSVTENEVVVEGIDMLNGTPVFDIKPFLKTDLPKGKLREGWSSSLVKKQIKVVLPTAWKKTVDSQVLKTLKAILKEDPRPSSQRNRSREFFVRLGEFDFRLSASEDEKEIHFKAVSFIKD